MKLRVTETTNLREREKWRGEERGGRGGARGREREGEGGTEREE